MSFKHFSPLLKPGFASGKKFFISLAFAVILTFGLTVSLEAILADWTAPLTDPPACAAGSPGCDAPINVGPLLQIKKGGLYIINDDDVSNPYGLIVEKGKVGIGTNLPTEKLEVAGKIKGTELCIGNDCKNSWPSGGGASQWMANGSDIYYNAGKVGIGTFSPNNLLAVLDLIDFNNTDYNTKVGFQAGKNLVAGAQNNTFLGYQAGLSSLAGSTNTADRNTATGYQALYSNTSGSLNTAIGDKSLFTNTTGEQNTAVGVESLKNNTTGAFNVSVGYGSLRDNTSGDNNSVMGNEALRKNLSGSRNTTMGDSSLALNTIGDQNTSSGVSSLYNNVSGGNNTAIGVSSMFSNTTGSNNVAIGAQALYSNQIGNNNVAVGFNALYDNNPAFNGSYNVAVGFDTAKGIVTGNNNTVLGSRIQGLPAPLSNNIIIADGAGNQRIRVLDNGNVGISNANPTARLDLGQLPSSTEGLIIKIAAASPFSPLAILKADGTEGFRVKENGRVGIGVANPNSLLAVFDLIDFDNTDYNTKIGYLAGKNLVGGAQSNTFIGYKAGFSSSAGSTDAADYNSAFGALSLYSNTSGYANVAIGRQSLYANTSGKFNVAVGLDTLNNNTVGEANTAIGINSLYTNSTGNYNTAIGQQSLKSNFDGSNNTANGSLALFKNTSGSYNTAAGTQSLNNNTTGYINTAYGYQSLNNNLTGTGNTAIGTQALFNLDTNYGFGYNTAVGSNAGAGLTSGVDNTIIGANIINLPAALSKATIIGASFDGAGLGNNNIVIADGSGIRRINVDASGNVSIGTTTPATAPASRVQIDGTINKAFLNLRGTNWSAGGQYVDIIVTNPNSTDVYTKIRTITGANWSADLAFFTNPGGGSAVAATERMRILANGNVGIGTNNPGYKLEVNGTAHRADNSTLWTQTSDARLKKNIEPLNNSLDLLSQLKPVSFNWIDSSLGSDTKMGFIAQDVEPVFPTWVQTNSDGYKTLTLNGIEALFTGAIKELANKLADLVKKVEDLISQVFNHEDRIKKLEQASLEQQKQIDELKNEIEALKSK